MSTDESTRRPALPAPLPAQLDLSGDAHELAPATERLRLFEPAPVQLAGQLDLGEIGGEQ